jgi:hypothetical protein
LAGLRVALLALAILFLAPSVVLAEDHGVIAGTLENRTPGGTIPAGSTVTLRVFRGHEFDRYETVVSSADGSFVFSGLGTGPTSAYRVLAEFQGGLFAGDTIAFANEDSVQVVVPVYETVTADPGLRTTQHSLVLTSGGDRSLGALHVVTLDLPGHHALIVGGDAGPAIEFVTRPEVTDFRALQGFAVAELEGNPSGFYVTMTVTPGANQFTFSYVSPWDPGGMELAVGARPAIGALQILTSAGDLVVEGDSVRPGEELDFDGMGLESWFVDAPTPGAFNFVWLREPRSFGPLAAVGRVPAGVWGGVGVAVFGLVLAFSAWRAPTLRPTSRPDDEAAVKRLLAEIADCDRESDVGSRSELTDRRRASAKQELLELLRADARLQRYLEE